MEYYIKRTIEKALKKCLASFPVTMITGPRQVGKTTLLTLFDPGSNINYVTLDDLKLRGLASTDPELFLATYETPLIIDEFQYAPNLLVYIKQIVDKQRIQNLKNNRKMSNSIYYLTGSQVFHTMKNVSDSLAGRVGILDLYGLTTREINNVSEEMFLPDIDILKQKQQVNTYTPNLLFDRILKGSYPEIYTNESIDLNLYYSTYIRTYIERDIRELINVKDENKFLKFITSIAARTAQELNINDIASSVEITNPTAEAWLSILKNTGLVYLLQPYFNNDLKRAIKRPKIYFMDTGLSSYLTGYTDAKTLERSAYNGAIFETYVITEIVKSYTNSGLDSRKHLYYYRDNNNKEIDLIITYNNKVYPIEIKKSSNPTISAIKNFDVVEKFGMEVGNGGVICMYKDLFPIDENNYYIPIELI